MQLGDFDFVKHPAGFQARKLFDNGFGASIIPESDGVHYEIAILRHNNGKHARLCYDSGLTDDVIRYATVDEVHEVIFRARNLRSVDKVTP
jgi:hypothetical protein